MGKSPEKASGSTGGVVMRYRRKVPTSTSTSSPPHADNQMEHREPEPVAGEASSGGKAEAIQQAPKSKLLNPGGPTRKKKPKAHAKDEPPVETPVDAPAMPALVDAVDAAPSASSVPKKKLKKRQLSNNNNGNNNSATPSDEPGPAMDSQEGTLDATVEGVQPKPTKQQHVHRKQKNSLSDNGKHKGPSLLKQLLWKAKPVTPPATSDPAVASSPAPRDGASPSPPAGDVDQQQQRLWSRQREVGAEAEDRDEQEEVAYTVSERRNRKLQASQNADQQTQAAACSDSCSPIQVVGGELSSQDTQSGSDEEENAPSFLSVYQNLVPSNAIEPKELPTAVHLNLFYPTPFPLALTKDVELLQQHGIKLHEVLIEDFTFAPRQLRVQPGDVVVWKVRGELGMVEHSLEASLLARNNKLKKPMFMKATTPPLVNGSSFAWRFKAPARIHVQCSVYQTKGVVIVAYPKVKKEKKAPAVETAKPEVRDAVATPPPSSSKPPKRKEKTSNRKRVVVSESRRAVPENDDDDGDRERDSVDSDAVFHPPQDLARYAEMDAGVCRAVLTQLEEVVAVAHTAGNNIILIGDVECPVFDDGANHNDAENPVHHDFHSDEKPSTLADEWSGTEEDDDDDDVDDDDAEAGSVSSHADENEIEDFQQRIIGMLKRSEEARAQHRRSFQQTHSGFDAGATYDFFKQRFMRVQEERQIVYAVCPEPTSGCGVGVTEVVSLLSGQ